jgi:transcriptional regulator
MDYKSKMTKGIVAFRIKVEEIQAKEKLSQNKTAIEQEKIIHHFSDSESENERLIAEFMNQGKSLDKDIR